MKKLIMIILLIAMQQIYAQEKTLVSSGEYASGGFGAPVLKYTSINKQGALMLGGRGGWIINHSFVLGGGIYGVASKVTGDILNEDIIEGEQDKIHFMYGGFEFEYIFTPMRVFHISLYTLLGAGNIFYLNLYEENHNMGQAFFVVEPAVNIELNITTFFHLAFGVSYRYTSGANYQTISDTDVSGFNGMLTFKFGKF